MTSIKRVLLSWIFMVLAAAAATAQTPEPWSLSLSADANYEDNVQLTPQSAGSLGSRLQAGLVRDWRLRRGGVTLGGDGAGLFYRDAPDLNQFTWGANAAVSYEVTRRLSWSFNDAANSSYAQDATLLIAAGVVLPKIITRTNSIGNNLSYALTPRSHLSWMVSSQQVAFETSAFSGGSTLGTRVSYTHQIGKSQNVGITADYQRTMTNGTTGTIQDLLGTWQMPIGKDSGISVAAGVQPYTLTGVSGFRFAPTVTASVNTRVRRADTLAFTYAHTVEQAFGFGRTQQSDNLSAAYSLNLTRKLSLSASGNYGQGTSPLTPDLKLIGETANLTARYAFLRSLAISAGYSIYTRTDEPNPRIASSRSNVSLTYGVAWR